eukprot:jgi/Ulvmu1/6061/UM027_0039.1
MRKSAASAVAAKQNTSAGHGQSQSKVDDSAFKCIKPLTEEEEMALKDKAAFARRRACNFSGRKPDEEQL